ncbi:MAG: transcription-repair coupling factor (superfamily II helicase) [Sphingobacteriales bacterium]|jgi:transcription-repair coupling factor (superfamily II helicase)
MTLEELIGKFVADDKINNLADILQDKGPNYVHLKSLVGSAAAFRALATHLINKQNFIIVLETKEAASYFHSDIQNLSDKNILFFPSSYKKEFNLHTVDENSTRQRADTLYKLNKSEEKGQIVVTYPEAITESVVDSVTLNASVFDVTLKDEINLDFLSEILNEHGFDLVDFVYEPGQYAVRGGIVDIFSYSNDNPYRLELLGDEIENIRTFDAFTQLSLAKVNNFSILPDIKESLQNNACSFLDVIPKDSTLWIKELEFVQEAIESGLKKARKSHYELETSDDLGKVVLPLENYYQKDDGIFESIRKFNVVEFGKHVHLKPTHTIEFNTKPQPSFNKNFNLLIENLQQNQELKIENSIFASSARQVERLYSIFKDLGASEVKNKKVAFSPIYQAISQGFVDHDLNIACYTDHQIFDRFYKYAVRKQFDKAKALSLKELRELQPGDFVTHIDHGIGKFAGLAKLEVNGKVQESIKLVYRDSDILFVNINALGRVSKYTGKEGTEPKLSKLGSDTWAKLKSKTKKKVKDIARDLIKLYAKRKAQDGTGFSPDTYLQTELEASFIYEDTPDQITATQDFKTDMESPHPMDRLVCGDVGFGKTEIAIRAAFKAATDSKQVAILCPTTVLAFQHYNTFKERLKDFPVNIDYVSRFRTTAEIKETLAKVKNHEVDILIGTHRIVSKDVQFKDIGLLIVDEEQKFGVATKEKLRSLKANVDTLTLTATPIPRTLHFSLMGARDLSIINTAPPNRQAVNTELHVFNEQLIQESILYELDRGGQVYFIHNRVKDIAAIANMIQKLCPDAKVGIGHGQLAGHELEAVMLDFVSGNIDVFVCTTIVESGLDISNANTIIINMAQNHGLSDLHQLRGRVGRSNRKAFCYLLSPPLSTLTPEARRRLTAIEEFSDLGSGFNVAMRDLDIRGAGNLLGGEQSGFIAEIGFEMYHKILDEAIHELKEEEFGDLFKDQKEKPYLSDCQIETDFAVHIPSDYVSSNVERLNLYKELAEFESEEQLEEFAIRVKDRFGPIPDETIDLFDVVRLQWRAKSLGFEKVSVKGGKMRMVFVSNPTSKYFESAIFQGILGFTQLPSVNAQLKEKNNKLALTINKVSDLHAAIEMTEKMVQSVPQVIK